MVIKKQTGFVLLSVLIITTITAMLAFSQVNNNLLQERIGGHQQKQLSARLAAEKGVFTAFAYIKAQNAEGKSNSEIQTGLQALASTDYSFPSIELNEDDDTFTLLSKGEVNGAAAYLKTEISIESYGLFDDAIAACDAVNVSGNGSVNSFAGAAYDSNSAAANGDVKALAGSVELSGAGSIAGDVIASGSITGADASNVTGKIQANNTGNLGACDPLAIDTEINQVINEQIVQANSDTNDDGSNYEDNDISVSSFVVGSANTSVTFGDPSAADAASVELAGLSVLGSSKAVYIFDDFSSEKNNTTITITGDVTFYIEGNMGIKNTTFTLADSSSSLTIFIKGTIDIDTGSEIFAGAYASGSNAPLTVYSSNTGSEVANANNADTAVNITGHGDIYMNLYAPKGAVSYKGNGNIMGALRGKVVDISGNGGIHYDEGLADIGASEAETSISYSSLYYYYP